VDRERTPSNLRRFAGIFWLSGRQKCCPLLLEIAQYERIQATQHARLQDKRRDGSDGTRTRDLRRDRLARASRRWTTIDAESIYSCGLAGLSRSAAAGCAKPISGVCCPFAARAGPRQGRAEQPLCSWTATAGSTRATPTVTEGTEQAAASGAKPQQPLSVPLALQRVRDGLVQRHLATFLAGTFERRATSCDDVHLPAGTVECPVRPFFSDDSDSCYRSGLGSPMRASLAEGLEDMNPKLVTAEGELLDAAERHLS
jgi:hypothetical protein